MCSTHPKTPHLKPPREVVGRLLQGFLAPEASIVGLLPHRAAPAALAAAAAGAAGAPRRPGGEFAVHGGTLLALALVGSVCGEGGVGLQKVRSH